MLNHSSSELHDIWSPFCVVLQHKINLSFLLDWLFLLCSKHNASSNFAKHLVRHISPSPFSSNDNRGKHIDGLFSFRMTHKPHLPYRPIKYCPALLKFMVHLLQNPCIKIIQPCQGNHFDVITFRNYSVRFFMSGLCVQRGKRGHSCSFHKFTQGLFYSGFSYPQILSRLDPTSPVLFFATLQEATPYFNGSSLIIFSFVHLLQM